jgi:hypothetical protein
MGVDGVRMDAALSDGGYAWARAGFRFDGRPHNLISRMEHLEGNISDKKFQNLLDRLRTAEFENLPLPKEILGLKTPWRKYFSEEELLKHYTTVYSPAATSLDVTINPNTTSLGELIMRGSKWKGVKDIGKGAKLRQTFLNGFSAYDRAKSNISSIPGKVKKYLKESPLGDFNMAPKGTGVEKVSGSKPLMNPNMSLFFKNIYTMIKPSIIPYSNIVSL